MTLEFMKQIETLADKEDNLKYILNDILMSRTGVVDLSFEIGITPDTLKSFLINRRTTSRINRMKMAKYCLLQEQK
jgi:hypothetical protein